MNGEDALVTVLFVDIRDFTPFADRVTAREAVALLNEFFGVVVPVLEEHGGRVQQFLGDGMLGVFGAPERLPDHADRGVAAAREIVASVEAHFGDRCRVSVGVNSGLVIVGTIGGGSRFDLGIIGDPVNVAARVEQATRRTGDSRARDRGDPLPARARRARAARVDRAQGQAGAGRRLRAGGGGVIRVLWLLAVVLTAAGTAIDVVLDWPDAYDLVADVAFLALGIGAATTGLIVTTRARGNAVGPLLLALGVGLGWTLAAGSYAQLALTSAGPASRRPVGRVVRRLAGHARPVRRPAVPAAAVPGRAPPVAALAARGVVHGRRGGGRHRQRRAGHRRGSGSSPTRRSWAGRPPASRTPCKTSPICSRCRRCCWPRRRSSCASAARAASSGCS